MKRNQVSAFTLIEMLTVMAIIAIIASLVVAVSGLVNKKAAVARAEGEIKAYETACESYKADNGTYPRNGDTDDLDPRVDAVPTQKRYEKASQYLYTQLSGDAEPENAPDFKPEKDTKVYFPFKPDHLNTKKDNGKIVEVKYIQDPFGQCYGYSTAAYKAEMKYREDVRKRPGTPRPETTPGYNVASYDMWSTGGTTTKTTSTTSKGEVDQSRWIKNW